MNQSRCFLCGKDFELDELHEIDMGNKKPVKICFICKRKHNKSIKGEGLWKGKKVISNGYIWLRMHDHPSANHGYVPEHRLICEKFIGRYLTKEEVIHHIDENRSNNEINNLMIFSANSKHAKWHWKLKTYGYLTTPMKRQIENRWKEYGK